MLSHGPCPLIPNGRHYLVDDLPNSIVWFPPVGSDALAGPSGRGRLPPLAVALRARRLGGLLFVG